MKSKSLPCILILVLLTASLFLSEILVLTKGETNSPTTLIYVNPPISAKEVNETGQEFTVAIRVAEVQYLQTWRFDLMWNSSLLEVPDDPGTPGIVEGVSEGTFLNQEGKFQTTLVETCSPGFVSVTCILMGVKAYEAPSGSGTLATVTFLVKAEGECPLYFNRTTLIKFEGIVPKPIDIPHTVEDGYFKHPLPILHLEPSSIMDAALGPGSNFTVNVKVARVTDLYAWDFSLYWNPAVLDVNVTSVAEGTFLNQNGTYDTDFLSETNQTEGYLHMNCTLVGAVPGANGEGTIATMSFLVEAKDQTYISLTLSRPPLPEIDATVLVDSEKVSIRHATGNCFFSNLLRDISVTKIEVSSTTVKVGESITVNVTVKNEGYRNETQIDVSVTTPFPPSPSYVAIGTTTILSLEPDQETTLTFPWNTKNVDKGEYTIRAEASTVPEEVDTLDNILEMDGTVNVTAPPGLEIPTTLIIGVIIAIAVVGTAIFLYARRRP